MTAEPSKVVATAGATPNSVHSFTTTSPISGLTANRSRMPPPTWSRA